ncbi:hypothetical protein QQ045_029432 [Rhodiola kirilowii]
MMKREAASDSQSRSKGEVAVSKLGKANRKHLSKKSLSSGFDSISKESLNPSPVSVVSDGVYCADPVKKRWSSEFASVSKDPLDPSPVSEVSDGVHSVEGLEVDTTASALSEAFSLGELTPSSQITTDAYKALEDMGANYIGCDDSIYSKIRTVEADVVVEHLKYAWIQILRSDGVDKRSKKLLGTMIKTVIEEFYGIPEDSDLLSKIVQDKTRIIIACLLLWMICTLMAVNMVCRTNIPFNGPLPT